MRGALLCGLLLHSMVSSALEITNVTHDQAQLPIAGDGEINIEFTLSEPARVVLSIYDARDSLVSALASPAPLSAGQHRLAWNGTDDTAEPVPPGAYHYTLTATTGDNEVVYDLTELTGGQRLPASNVAWDKQSQRLTYGLTRMARVNVRIGLKNGGPLLKTLLDWVPRAAGQHSEPWDGMDASGVINLAEHPRADFAVQAFALSDNTVLIGPDQSTEQLLSQSQAGSGKSRAARSPGQTAPQRLPVAQKPLAELGDMPISVRFPENASDQQGNTTVLSGTVPVRVDVTDPDRQRALNGRFEVAFYVDGLLVFENELGYLPITWRWQTATLNPGEHYLTVNLRGYQGNFGIHTSKVRIQRAVNKPATPTSGGSL